MTIPARLTSRKFWLTVGGFITLIASGAYTEAMALLVAYIGVQGAKEAVSEGKKTAPSSSDAVITNDDDDVDTTRTISGDQL
jgi:hypothetical protein